MDLDRLGKWAVENAMKIDPGKSKALRFTWARLKDPLKLFRGESKTAGSEQLQIFRKHFMQRLKLGLTG